MRTQPFSKYLPLVIGYTLVVILLIALFIFLEHTNNTLVYFGLLTILATGVALLTNYITGKATYVNKTIRAKGGYAIFVTIFFAGLIFYKWNTQSFDFTIYLRDSKDQTVLKYGTVRLLLNNAPINRRIDEEGSISFPGIPADLKGASVRAELVDDIDWQFTNKSRATEVTLKGNAATLTIEPNHRRCCLMGIVVDQKGQLVEGAEVWTDTLTPVVTTSTGRFTIELPLQRRMEDSFELYARKGKTQEHVSVNRIQEATIVLNIK